MICCYPSLNVKDWLWLWLLTQYLSLSGNERKIDWIGLPAMWLPFHVSGIMEFISNITLRFILLSALCCGCTSPPLWEWLLNRPSPRSHRVSVVTEEMLHDLLLMHCLPPCFSIKQWGFSCWLVKHQSVELSSDLKLVYIWASFKNVHECSLFGELESWLFVIICHCRLVIYLRKEFIFSRLKL